MRLASVHAESAPRAAVVVGEAVIDVQHADPTLSCDMNVLLGGGRDTFDRLEGIARSDADRVPLAEARLVAPVPRPQKFFAVGLNYADHVAESGMETPEFPTVFAKMPSCVNGPFGDIERPLVSTALDYEGELGFVIGRRCRHVSREDAPGVIAGYLVVNDVSVRDYQLRTSQWILGKSFDTHGVIGPWIVTGDELDPHALGIRTLVNGEVRQESNTSNLIHDCFAQVELLSSVCTLEPGDVVATGTPGGVGIASDPPKWLVPGDVVRVEIDGIGAVENRVVDERAGEPGTAAVAGATPAEGAAR